MGRMISCSVTTPLFVVRFLMGTSGFNFASSVSNAGRLRGIIELGLEDAAGGEGTGRCVAGCAAAAAGSLGALLVSTTSTSACVFPPALVTPPSAAG